MSKYTTELRFICENYAGRTESAGLNDVKTIVELACPKIFDDDIPFFDEAYRLPLEKKIIMHYYTREISGEVVGIWKLWLNNRMREIMPYYNQLYKSALIEFDPLLTKKFTEEYSGEGSKDTIGNKNESQTTTETNAKTSIGSKSDSGTTVSNSSNSDNATERRLYSDTPQGGLNNVEDETYLTNYTKNLGQANATASTNLSSTNTGESSTTDSGNKNQNVLQNSALDENTNTTESFLRSISGYDGGSASKLLQEFRDTFINIDVRIIDELGDLFFNLW